MFNFITSPQNYGFIFLTYWFCPTLIKLTSYTNVNAFIFPNRGGHLTWNTKSYIKTHQLFDLQSAGDFFYVMHIHIHTIFAHIQCGARSFRFWKATARFPLLQWSHFQELKWWEKNNSRECKAISTTLFFMAFSFMARNLTPCKYSTTRE